MDTLLLICSIPLGIIFCTLLLSLFTYISGKIYGFHFYSFEYFIFKIAKTSVKDSKLVLYRTPFKALPIVKMTKDNLTTEEDRASVKLSMLFMFSAHILIGLLLVATGIFEYAYSNHFFKCLISKTYAISAFETLILILLSFVTCAKKDELECILRNKVAEATERGKLTAVEFPDYVFKYPDSSNIVKSNYQHIRFIKAQMIGDMATMANIAHWFTCENNRIVQDATHGYLAFYYTYFLQGNPEAAKLATYHFNKIKYILSKCSDSNDIRIYAYYKYYIEHDPATARQLAQKGISLLPQFKDIEEIRQAEEKWLYHLLDVIDGVAG